ncbi:homospermidine synthase [Candidatus Kaiserbacteria bacterium RIFCSPLOWO2_01_FULL_54_13]|uniref:Homospermidine synthase n=1 Tax=Candidatus Kaiserbacteria bacterium RIFCSPLOWO2_01_FULL_54_13 TaxID=1798512 RepID=A0A1F6F0K0_9BACT|nr:MAG: homospermidine synthase [Candidatus Kaiserbacteria bacterium RIFCSPLOWO2_01_FULL_54_13]
MRSHKSGAKRNFQINFSGRILIVGFGSIGQGVLPLILRHIKLPREKISIITADKRGRYIARKEGIRFEIKPITKDNYEKVLKNRVRAGDFLVNLSVDVSSLDLIKFCQDRDVLYIDTCIEPWKGVYDNPSLTISERSNYGLRENALALKGATMGKATAVIAHGANPGIVSHFVKQALLNIARKVGVRTKKPRDKKEWAALMRKLGIRTIHIAEYDSQVASTPKKLGRFENTWSVFGFYAEGINQACELGWGTHEKHWPEGASRHDFGCGAGIYLDRPGAKVLVRTWTPKHGTFLGRVVTHNESISIADYFTVRERGKAVYRPTVHYAYRSCDASILSIEECLGQNSVLQENQHILLDEIVSGMDELGVLLMGHKKGAYWYGSQLTIEETRKLAPYQNATGLQVTAAVLGGMVWAMEHPREGIVEADEIDHERIMEIVNPYMGKMTGAFTDWTPLKRDGALFADESDAGDPWQFKNFLFT